MPNRVIRDGILSSERVDAIADDPSCEVFYRRLFSVVDDFGRFSGDPRMIRAATYPLRLDATPEARIREHLASCEAAGLLVTYTVNGKPYLELSDFHQRLRLMISKYPSPPIDGHAAVNGRRESESESESRIRIESESKPCASQRDPRITDNSLSVGEKTKHAPSVRKRANANPEQAAWFEQFWAVYWLRKARKPAFVAFVKAVKSPEVFEAVIAAIAAQSEEMFRREPQHRPHAASWLNAERWNDSTEEKKSDSLLDQLYPE